MPLEFPGLNDLQKLQKRMKALEDTVEKLNKDLVKNAAATKKAGRAAATASGNVQRLGIAFSTTLAPITAIVGGLALLNRLAEYHWLAWCRAECHLELHWWVG